MSQGNPAGALEAYHESRAILARLTAADPDNAGWQRDLIVLHFKLAMHSQKTGDAVRGREYLRQCHDALRRMQAREMHLDPALVELLRQLDAGTLN